MSAAQQPEQPADDLMALADAVGVTVPAGSLEASVALLLTDDRLDAVVSGWARAYAAPQCTHCEDEGIVEIRHWKTGWTTYITCPSCHGDDVTDRGGRR